MGNSTVTLDGQTLTLEDVERVARHSEKVSLGRDAAQKVVRARQLVEARAESTGAFYGINTGFGALAKVRIPKSDLAQLQINLIRSHAAGVGPALTTADTRALMLLRANVMATGRSGVRLQTLEMLLAMIDAGIHPIIPSKGSVGASGDLAPLAHLALTMIGEGDVEYQGTIMESHLALARAQIAPLRPEAKEGLCLINGTQAMGALGVLATLDAERLCTIADIAGAVSLEGKRGTPVAFDALIHAVRPHPGQIASAENFRKLLANSAIVASHADCDEVQDAYSFRCMPQVHGATRDVLSFVRRTLEIELNSGTDNPLVFAEQGEGDQILSGGNFHGQPLAFALDFLAIATGELADISDRRVEQLIDPALSKLPAFLMRNPGLHSGFMMAQVTAASLVNENRILSHPASIDSIPTSANREDHVSMGMTSARKGVEVVKNTRACLAIELLAACQAVDLVGLTPGNGAAAAHAAIRARIPHHDTDRVLAKDIAAADQMIESGEIRAAVEARIGTLV